MDNLNVDRIVHFFSKLLLSVILYSMYDIYFTNIYKILVLNYVEFINTLNTPIWGAIIGLIIYVNIYFISYFLLTVCIIVYSLEDLQAKLSRYSISFEKVMIRSYSILLPINYNECHSCM